MNELRKIVYNANNVFFPKTIEEIEQIIKENKNITISNGFSEDKREVVLSLEKMNKIIDIDFDKKEAYVEAGAILSDLQKQANKKGLEFPIDIFTSEIDTIGSLLARNVTTIRDVKYGKIIDWVKEIEVINGGGRFSKLGKTDLSDFVGMEGITGVIVKVRLKLINKPRRTATLFKTEEMSKIIDSVKKIKLMQGVSMIEFFDKQVSELIGLSRNYYLLVEFENDKGKLKEKEYDEIIKNRKNILHKLALAEYIYVEDVKLYIDKLSDFVLCLEKANIPVFGYLGSGILHPVFHSKERIKDVLEIVKKLHGRVYANFGIGKKKKQFLDDNEKMLIERVKKRNDPKNRFNKGVIIDYEPEILTTNDEEEIREDILEEDE